MAVKKRVAVVTPTILKSVDTLKRCVESVQRQTYEHVDHIVIVDGYFDSIYNSIEDYLYQRGVKLFYTGEDKSNTWGAYPRQWFLDRIHSALPDVYEYVVHVDDDNYIFPEYVEELVNGIEASGVDASICQIYHHGPVSMSWFPSYQAINTESDVVCIVKGDPPVLQNIDTLNVMVKTKVMAKYGWVTKAGDGGYCNDGETFEKMFSEIDYAHVNKILGIHY